MGMLDEILGELMQGQGRMAGSATQAPAGMPGSPSGLPSGMPGLGALGGAGGLLAVIMQLVQQNGGLSGLVQAMQKSGFGDHAQSWIGSGENRALPADALSQIFGSDQLQQIAQQFGVSGADVSSQLADALPKVVDRMTPQGSLPADGDDLVARTLDTLLRGQR
ncbi:MAG: DUF937 domain-containing protein [Burkholderiales bacterium]|nr:DUF937 domain-containing protein [Burkholderiales bacterium]